MMKTIAFTKKEIEKLHKLIKELDSYYEYDDEFGNRTEEWNFEDVDSQREIALDIVNVLRNKI